ncbi:hypothetical protein PENSUB_11612 [Penicillium subrubescens]|uniref:Uncharacterized protein n=1 Tax=Penicillium subrubescens TaxID=1316194 RepID=A0A1Q5T2K0_9EURO|nr:hypothetical protein PENSUB_11612 [Penicillium subrubescens]
MLHINMIKPLIQRRRPRPAQTHTPTTKPAPKLRLFRQIKSTTLHSSLDLGFRDAVGLV